MPLLIHELVGAIKVDEADGLRLCEECSSNQFKLMCHLQAFNGRPINTLSCLRFGQLALVVKWTSMPNLVNDVFK